jgi:hypothetical protein
MRKTDRPASVFVPFEHQIGGFIRRCDDLPRFTDPKDVIRYLSSRNDLSTRRLDWIEHFDKESIDEYMLGLGEGIPSPIIRIH